MRKLYILILGVLAGLLIVWYLSEQAARQSQPEKATALAGKSPQPQRTARQAEQVAVASDRRWQGTDEAPPVTTKDALTDINGIGPAFEKALNNIGIFSFEELAAQDPDTLANRMNARVTAQRIRRDRWIEQAQVLAKGR